jgi:hypothetical protein
MLEMLIVMAVMANVSATPYDSQAYSCWDYATDMQSQLRSRGIGSHIVFGTWYGSFHAWVEADGEWFDPTFNEAVEDREGYRRLYYAAPRSNGLKAAWVASFKSQ